MKSKSLRQLHNNLWTLLLHQLLLEEVPSSHLHLTCFGPEVMTVPISPCGWDLFSALTIVSFLSSVSTPFLNDTQLNATLGHLMNCCTKWKHPPSSNVMLSSAAKSVFVHENVPLFRTSTVCGAHYILLLVWSVGKSFDSGCLSYLRLDCGASSQQVYSILFWKEWPGPCAWDWTERRGRERSWQRRKWKEVIEMGKMERAGCDDA